MLMGILDWLFRRRKSISHVSPAQSNTETLTSHSEPEFIDIQSHGFFGQSIKSPNGQFTLAWRDADDSGMRGGSRSQGKGKYIVLRGRHVTAQGAVARPNDGKIADNGNFILNDSCFGDALQGVFLAFDSSGKILVKRRFKANLFNNGISTDGTVAACQTANAYEGEDGSKLTIFDLRTRVEIASWIPTSGWADFYNFPSEGIIQLGYKCLGLFAYSWSGEFLDSDEWRDAQLARGDYATVMMAVEQVLKTSQGEPNRDLSERLNISLQRISGQILATDIRRLALLRKLQGQCAELRGDVAAALVAYDAALEIDSKVGVKRRAEQLRKAAQAR